MCSVQHNRANVIPRSRKDRVPRGIGYIFKQLVLKRQFTWTFSLEKFRIGANMFSTTRLSWSTSTSERKGIFTWFGPSSDLEQWKSLSRTWIITTVKNIPQSNYALNATSLAINNTHTLYCEKILLITSSEQRENGGEEKIETGLLKYRIMRMRDKRSRFILS